MAAAEAVNLADVYFNLIPTVRSMEGKVSTALAPGQKEAARAGAEQGAEYTRGFGRGSSGFGGFVKKTMVGSLAAAGAAGAAVLGVALTKGFQRLGAIEDASAKLKGLGNDAKATDEIMANALASVKGTAFGMDEAATTAASAVAAGIKPGKDLTRYLGLVGDAATIAGTGMGEMGAIFNKVATSGKVQGDVFAQLGDQGIPVVQQLAKVLNVSADEVYEMGRKGQISSDQFLEAMSSMQGAALKSGNTTSGAFKNVNAALGRFGAALLGGVFPLAGKVFNVITKGVDLATDAVKPLATAVGTGLVNAFVRVTDAGGALYALLVEGDYTGKLRQLFGWEEDAPAVDLLLSIREELAGLFKDLGAFGKDVWAILQPDPAIGRNISVLLNDGVVFVAQHALDALRGLRGGFRDFWAGITLSDADAAAIGEPLDGFVAVGQRTRHVIDALKAGALEATGGLRAFGAAWAANDGDITSSGFAGYMERAAFALHGFWDTLRQLDFSSWDAFTASLGNSGGPIGDALGSIGDSLADLMPAVAEFVRQLPDIGVAAGKLAAVGLQAVTGVLSFLADHVDTIIALMPFIVAGFVAWKVASTATEAATHRLLLANTLMAPVLLANNALRLTNNIIEARAAATANVSAAATSRSVFALGAQKVALLAASAASRAAAAAQWVMNAALSANPIGIVILAVTALVAAVVWFVTQTEWGKNLIAGAWAGIQAAIGAVAGWWTGTAWPAIQVALQAMGAGFTWLYQNVIAPAFRGIAAVIQWWWNGIVMPVFNIVKWYITSVLAPVYTWLWNNIVVPAFRGIASIIGWAWNAIVLPIFNALNAFVRNVVGPTVSWLWNNVVVPAFRGISGAIGAAWTWIRDVVFTPLNNWVRSTLGAGFEILRTAGSNAWEGLKTAVNTVYTWIKNNVFSPLQTLVKTTIPDAFDKGVGFIKGFWNKLQDIAKAPVKFVIETVINKGLIDTFNNVAGWFPGVTKLNPVSLPDGFAGGGILPGTSRWRDGDNLLFRGRGGEGVQMSEAMDSYETNRLLHMNAEAKKGRSAEQARASWNDAEGAFAGGPPGGPSGGIWGQLQAAANRAGYMYIPHVNLNYGGDTEKAAKAWMGQSALDIRMGTGSPGIRQFLPGGPGGWGYYQGDTIWERTPAQGGPKTSAEKTGVLVHEIGHALSLMHTGEGDPSSVMNPLMRGGNWPHEGDYATLRSVWGEPGANMKRYSASDVGIDAGGAQANPLSWLLDRAGDLVKGAFPDGGKFVDLALGAAKGTIQSAIDFVGSKLGMGGGHTEADAGQHSASEVEGWIRTALKIKGLDTPNNVALGVRRAMQESSGNPYARNDWDVNAKNGDPSLGLMQTIGATFRAYMEPGHGDIFAPVDNALASINYVLATYPSLAAGWGRAGGYALGGITDAAEAAVRVFDGGGWLERTAGPQLVQHNLAKPDAVTPYDEYVDMRDAAIRAHAGDGAGGLTVHGDVYAVDPDDLWAQLEEKRARKRSLRGPVTVG